MDNTETSCSESGDVMSIAEREAENAGPEYAYQRLRLDMDDVRDAYVAGRTAEPCKEQIEAAAKVLADWSDPCTDCFEDRCRNIANLMLGAARKAVM